MNDDNGGHMKSEGNGTLNEEYRSIAARNRFTASNL